MGYIVAKYAAPHAEPLTFLLLRYTGVVLLVAALALAFRAAWPSRGQTLHLAGIGIQAAYLGGVWVAVKQRHACGCSSILWR